MENNFRQIENLNEWQALLNKTKFVPFFCNINWEELLASEYQGMTFIHYIYRDKLLLSVASFKTKKGIRYVSHPFCEYGGPMPLEGNINWPEFVADVKSVFGQEIKINIHPAVLEYFMHLPVGDELIYSLASYWVDRKNKSEEEILSSVRKTLRQEISKQKSQSWQIETCDNEADLRVFYDIYILNMRNKQNLALPYRIFLFLLENQQLGNVEIKLAKMDGKIYVGSIFLKNGQFWHYFINASLIGKENPSSLILINKLVDCARNGFILDLGGTRDSSSLSVYKEAWHGIKKPIMQIGLSASSAKSKARLLWKYLPKNIIPRVSKLLYKKAL